MNKSTVTLDIPTTAAERIQAEQDARFDAVWQRILADPELASVRQKLSIHELHLIIRHMVPEPEGKR